jgi:hypothetical protein
MPQFDSNILCHLEFSYNVSIWVQYLIYRRGLVLSIVHPEMDGHQLVLSQICSRSRCAKNLTAGIWLIFRGLNFSRNADIGQIGH